MITEPLKETKQEEQTTQEVFDDLIHWYEPGEPYRPHYATAVCGHRKFIQGKIAPFPSTKDCPLCEVIARERGWL